MPTAKVDPGDHVEHKRSGMQPVPVHKSSTWSGVCGDGGVIDCASRRAQYSVSGRGINTGRRVRMSRWPKGWVPWVGQPNKQREHGRPTKNIL